MKRQCLLLTVLLGIQMNTTCYVENSEQKSGANISKSSNAISAYERWIKSNDGLSNDTKSRNGLDARTACQGVMREIGGETCSQESYYDSLIRKAAEHRWALPFTFDYSFESKAFDSCGNRVSLGESLFGQATTVQDIFLLARLSAEGKLHIHQRGFEPTSPQFGNSSDQQYLALLAPMQIGLTATQSNATLGFDALYRWRPFDDTRFSCIFGVDFPVQIQKKCLGLSFQKGTLLGAGYIPNATNRESVLTQFFKDWSSVEDFFIRGVLGSKGITFIPNQQSIGLGDLSLSANFEFGPFYRESEKCVCRGIDFGQLGFSVGFPTGKQADSSLLWGTEFGNGGGFQFTFFGTCNTRTGFSFLNPTWNFGVEVHTWACRSGVNGIRVPRTVTATPEMRVVDVPHLDAPVFKEFLTDAFSEPDTKITLFADSVTDAFVRVGRRAFVSVGNYFYDIFNTSFRLGIFYTYASKKCDKICVRDSSLVTTSLQCPSSSNRLSWKLSYKFKNLMELGFGSQHVLAGRNIPESHDIFCSFVASF
jgi:hypothetical protein